MKIATFAKHVPISAVTPKIAADRSGIEDANLAHEVNETDLYAIEEAVHQRSLHQGSVVAITIGWPRAKEALHVAYARGVGGRRSQRRRAVRSCLRPVPSRTFS
jgi:electron transfer flavoprotein alpha/beta subunit